MTPHEVPSRALWSCGPTALRSGLLALECKQPRGRRVDIRPANLTEYSVILSNVVPGTASGWLHSASVCDGRNLPGSNQRRFFICSADVFQFGRAGYPRHASVTVWLDRLSVSPSKLDLLPPPTIHLACPLLPSHRFWSSPNGPTRQSSLPQASLFISSIPLSLGLEPVAL